ncbi:MAG TPA: methylenetetrahydrofolate--tRNA-(uracil(54)-C(5))-methyltransferase (FADH(2)-oxidizing) TrmFO [Blastocatellia bacterium]|nr:methylenetetrahydrofolate--tRNA-(uracil(54)-C(5))-methyltransferase (FADH(2)-oxidizing) TrmFO [Blastocatellia bacterium]
MSEKRITVIGGGLAGSEAAWQAAQRGGRVRLYEMRPAVRTPAHESSNLGEIVCSNSLKSDEPGTAPYLLKEELRRAGSLLIRTAHNHSVPAGTALAVDRQRFSQEVTRSIENHPNIEVCREEVRTIPDDGVVVVATGPLTSPALSEEIARVTGSNRLYFYDAIAPVVESDTINYDRVFRAARYGKGGDDYVNCPMNEEQYDLFLQALMSAESVPLHEFEQTMYFEGCLPIEEIARRGRDTLRYGPMKPTGLVDPLTGRQPFAAVQLRQENLLADSYNLVGFQNHLKFGDQKKVLRLIPGLEQAEFVRFGQIHRNTFICAPAILSSSLQVKQHPRILFAGQICGVEGYIEAMATGLMAGVHASRISRGGAALAPPRKTAMGSLVHYVSSAPADSFQPMNITFSLLPPLDEADRKRLKRKADRHRFQVELALKDFDEWVRDYLSN